MNIHRVGGIHVGTLPVLLLVLGFAPVFTPAARAQTTQPDDLQQRIDERMKRQQEEEKRRIERLLQQFADRTREVVGTLGELGKKGEALDTRMKALLKNDDGKRLAADPDAFMEFIETVDKPPLTAERVASRKRAIEAILTGLRSDTDNANVGFLPGEAPRREVEDADGWARERLVAIGELQAWFDTAIAKAPKELDLSKRVTLEEAIQAFRAERREAARRVIMRSREEAQREMEKELRDTAKKAQEEEERAKIERLLRESRAEMERQRIEYETRLKAMLAEQKQQAVEAEIRYKDLMAELERARILAEARRKAEDLSADIEKKKIEEAALKQQRIQKCQSPEVQQLLAPFLTKGYWQPGDKVGANVDLKPISYSKLSGFGALQPTTGGIQKLLQVATKDIKYGIFDKVRPRWPYTSDMRKIKPEQLEEAKKAQALLIELGEVMVEQGMLSP
ncbi:hypothetical protein RAS1_07740 [Phycisphaerae bacterium RAS1]|nr:hypothetical protein RAS1_07740 [Phycisphaerae bacterium RAS1]